MLMFGGCSWEGRYNRGMVYLFQALYEPAVSPVRSPVRIPSPETVTPPLSASDVERNMKDAVSTDLVLQRSNDYHSLIETGQY